MSNHFSWDKVTTAGGFLKCSLHSSDSRSYARAQVYCEGPRAQKKCNGADNVLNNKKYGWWIFILKLNVFVFNVKYFNVFFWVFALSASQLQVAVVIVVQ